MNDGLWSAQAWQDFLPEAADVLQMANSGHRRINMEIPETKLTSTKRQVWNAGRTVGAKRALKPKQIWASIISIT
ncbi:MAG: hypothetical protein AB7D33_04975 [Sphingobium sp.]